MGLVAIVAIAALAIFLNFAQQQNRGFVEGSQRLVQNTIDGRSRSVADITLDFASWNDAYQAVSVRWNGQWVSDNFYSGVTDGLVIFTADGVVRHTWVADSQRNNAQRLTIGLVRAARAMPSFAQLPHAPTAAGTVAHGLISLDGRLALIAVAPIAPEEDAERIAQLARRPASYLAVVQVLEPNEIAEIGRSLDLGDFAFDAEREDAAAHAVRLPVHDANGQPIGALQWRDARPGDAALASQLVPVVLGLLLIGALTIVVARALVMRQVKASSHAEAALESSRLKSEFISMMSHELRTPLNAIIGYAELIQEEGPRSPAYQAVRDDADQILSAARHLHQLVNDILDQSRIEAGHLQLRPERLMVWELFTEIEDLMAPSARARGINLEISAQDDRMHLIADHHRVRQCLLNLVSNAIKFTKDGTVSLRARHAGRNGIACITFDVLDDGIGIDAAQAATLFEPFAQANEGIQREYGGAGLGLSISRKLARAMGGDITFVSELGKGSCFSLNLPVKRDVAASPLFTPAGV
jgi:signal transduction histidine kinase